MNELAKALLQSGKVDLHKYAFKLKFGKSLGDVRLAVAKARMLEPGRQVAELSAALLKIVKPH